MYKINDGNVYYAALFILSDPSICMTIIKTIVTVNAFIF